MDIADNIKKYLEFRRHEVDAGAINEKTFLAARQAMGRVAQFWGSKAPTEINRETWTEFVAWHNKNYQGQTLYNVQKYFRHLCRFMHERIVDGRPVLQTIPRLIDPNAKRDRINRKKRKKRIFTDDEISSILKASNKDERLLILLMFTMGFRVGEACGLRWDNIRDLDTNNPYYEFDEENNKAGHIGTQSLSSAVASMLMGRYRVSEFVFPRAKDNSRPIYPQQVDFKGIKERSGVKWAWSSHTFRHSCLSRLFSDPSISQTTIMKCFRVSLKVAVETYIHISASERDKLKDAISISKGGIL